MSKIRESAKGEDCTIRLPRICSFNPEQTVLCHQNSARAGKGGAKKSEDALGAYGCYSCHMIVDRQHPLPPHLSWEEVYEAFQEGHFETFLKLKANGLVTTK